MPATAEDTLMARLQNRYRTLLWESLAVFIGMLLVASAVATAALDGNAPLWVVAVLVVAAMVVPFVVQHLGFLRIDRWLRDERDELARHRLEGLS